MNKEKASEIIQDMYEKYNFGENVVAVDDDGWVDDGSYDYTKIVYVEFLDAPESESHRVSFHVKLNKDTLEVEDVYGLLMSNGAEIGFLPKPTTSVKPKI